MEDAEQKIKASGVDGVMIGTGIFKNLWIFDRSGKIRELTLEQRIEQLLKHTRLFTDVWGNKKSFAILKKFFKCYLSDFDGAAEIRAKFMETNNLEDVEKLAASYIIEQ